MLKKHLLFVFYILLNFHCIAATWFSTNGTSITNVANWKANSNGTGASPADFNTVTDIFILQAGHTCFNFSNMVMAGTLTVNGTLNADLNLTIGGTGILNGTGTVNVTRTTATADFSSQYTIATKTLTNLTVDYTVANGGQTISAITYGNLRLSNTSGTNTAAGNIIVNGTLTTTSGGILNMGANQLLGSFVPSNNGIIKTSNTSKPAMPVGLTWGGTVEYTATTGGQFIPNGTYNNLTLFNTSGVDSITQFSTTTVNGTLTTTAGGTIAIRGSTIAGNGTFNLGGDLGIQVTDGVESFITMPTLALGTTSHNWSIGQSIPTVLNNDLEITSVISGSGSITKTGTGDVLLSGANTYTGTITSNSGIFAVNDESNLGPAPSIATAGNINLLNSGRLDINSSGILNSKRGIALTGAIGIISISYPDSVSYGGIIAGTGNFEKERSGKLMLTAANTYTGSTTVTRGTLNIQNAASISTSSGTTVVSGASLQLQGGITFNSEPLTINGTGGLSLPYSTVRIGALNNFSGNNTWQSTVNLGSNATIQSDAGTLTLSNASSITGNTRTVTFQGAGNGIVQGVIATTTGGLIKEGTGTWTLSGSNTYTGSTTITAGVLALGKINTISSSSPVNMNGGTLSTAGFADNVGAISLTNNSVISLGGASTNALKFLALSSFTSGKILTINNWEGTLGATGTKGQVFIGTTASMTVAQLAQIQFYISPSTYPAMQLISGEIVPKVIPLPITLLYFRGSKTQESSLLSWATALEIDSKAFVVQRSCDGFAWEEIGTTPTQQGIGKKEYQMLDPKPCQGVNYYKLVEITTKGESNEYNVIALEYDHSNVEFEIYPNPNNGIFHVRVNGDYPHYDLYLFDVLGKEHATSRLFNGHNLLEFAHLASSMYFVKLKINKDWVTKKILIEKL